MRWSSWTVFQYSFMHSRCILLMLLPYSILGKKRKDIAINTVFLLNLNKYCIETLSSSLKIFWKNFNSLWASLLIAIFQMALGLSDFMDNQADNWADNWMQKKICIFMKSWCKRKKEAECFFFTKGEEMSRVGSRDRHTWWRSEI